MNDAVESVDLIQQIVPIYQLCAILLVGSFAVFSVLARFWPRLGKMWDPKRSPNSFGHIFQYTITPVLVFVGMCVGAWLSYTPGSPWLGSHSLLRAVLTILAGIAAIVAFSVGFHWREGIESGKFPRSREWPASLLILLGCLCMFAAISSTML